MATTGSRWEAGTIGAMERVWSRAAAPARLVAGLLAFAAGAGAVAVAEGTGRSTTFAGASASGAALTLAAGLGLIAGGLVTGLGRRAGRTGDLALLAGFTWFAPVWVGWQEGPPLVRSLAMVLGGLTFPLVLHLVLGYPAGRTASAFVRALPAVVYAETVLAALGLALLRDPYFDPGCWANCTDNVFLVRSIPPFAHAIQVADRWFVATAAVALIAICVARLATGSRPARRTFLPIAAPAVLFAGTVTARAIALEITAVEDPFNRGVFAIFATGSVALILLAAGLISAVVRNQLERRAIARIVANLDEAPAPGSIQSALALALGDQDLHIAYWLPGTRRYVDANGRAVSEPAAVPGRTVTRLLRNDRTIAVIAHAGTVPELERAVGPAVLLGLENERLQAEVLAQLDELRASRARIVETGDVERRRLERDLHDGAQQRLLALSYDIRLARASAEADGDTLTETTLAQAIRETQGRSTSCGSSLGASSPRCWPRRAWRPHWPHSSTSPRCPSRSSPRRIDDTRLRSRQPRTSSCWRLSTTRLAGMRIARR